MAEYRTGNTLTPTIIREGGQLVAVVVGGQELAERICALLNGDKAEGYKRAIATLADVAARSGSYAARWAAEYLDADPDKRGPAYDAAERGGDLT